MGLPHRSFQSTLLHNHGTWSGEDRGSISASNLLYQGWRTLVNSDQTGLCKSALLTKLLSGKTKKMTRAAIDKHLRSEKVAKHLSVDDAAIQLALDELVSRQFLTEKKGRGASSYQ